MSTSPRGFVELPVARVSPEAAGSVAVLCALYALSLLALSRSVETLLPQIR